MARDYSYQETAISETLQTLDGQGKPCILWSSPTGSGKTHMQVEVLKRKPGGLQIIPTLDIGRGFAREFGINPESSKLREELQSRGVYTVKVLSNLLNVAEQDFSWVQYLQIDEAHHSVDNTHLFVDSWFPGRPRVGWTATEYRGTAKETAKLHDWWGGNVKPACTLKKAIENGVYSLPKTTVWPLLDDDQLDLANGEFAIRSVEAGVEAVMGDAVDRIVDRFWFYSGRVWDRPTVLAVNSVSIAEKFADKFLLAGVSVDVITADTSAVKRSEVFRKLERKETLLIQVSVLEEGTDLAYLRRLIDLSPTMSPVRCVQRVGRITRPVSPGEAPPEWIVCNHNLLRHAYLWKGLIPRADIKSAVDSWGKGFKPTSRMCARMVSGMAKGFGRLKPVDVPTITGDPWFLYAFGVTNDFETRQFCVLTSPGISTAIMAERAIPERVGGKNYEDATSWTRIKSIPDLEGATSLPTRSLSPGQQKFWANAARSVGLNPEATINAKQFAVLPLLKALNLKIPTGGL